MSAFIPNRRDPEVTAQAFEKVAADKKREAGDGFDGTWVAHPDLVPAAEAEFDAVLGDRAEPARPAARRRRRDGSATCSTSPSARRGGATVTRPACASNVSVAIRYIESWLRGTRRRGDRQPHGGRRHRRDLPLAGVAVDRLGHPDHDDGLPVTRDRVETILRDVVASLPREPGNRIDDAAAIFREVALQDDFPAFLTNPAYQGRLVGSPVDRP